MIWKNFLKANAMFFSIGIGIVVAVMVVSPFIWHMNLAANEGPIFPPPLVALGFFGLPYAFLLLLLQLIVVLYEFFQRQSLGLLILVAAVVDGLLAGILWSLVMRSSETEPCLFFL